MAILRNNPGNIEILNMNRSLLDKEGNLRTAIKKDLSKLKDKEMPSGFFYRNSTASQWAGMNGMYAVDRKDEPGKKPFTQFAHKMWGIRAMFKVLQGSGYFQLIDGQIRNEAMKKSVNVFNKYAPSTENNVNDYNGRVDGMMQGKVFTGAKGKYTSDQAIARQYNIITEDFDPENIKPGDIPNFIKAMIVMENGTKTFTNDKGEQERFVDYYLSDEKIFKMAQWAAQRDYSEDETFESVQAAYDNYLKEVELGTDVTLTHELGEGAMQR